MIAPVPYSISYEVSYPDGIFSSLKGLVASRPVKKPSFSIVGEVFGFQPTSGAFFLSLVHSMLSGTAQPKSSRLPGAWRQNQGRRAINRVNARGKDLDRFRIRYVRHGKLTWHPATSQSSSAASG